MDKPLRTNEYGMERKNNIKLSIITVNYNNCEGLKKTIDSVSKQTCNCFEHVIVDGGSSDGSAEFIHEYSSSQHEYDIFWMSETDKGIYNAMNKGIQRSHGNFLLFINSGDLIFGCDVVGKIVSCLDEAIDVYSGALQYVEGENVCLWEAPIIIDLDYCIKKGLTHPNTIINKRLFKKYGYYNEDNRIVSDWEFFLISCGLHKAVYQRLAFPVAVFFADGISTRNSHLLVKEKKRALRRLLPLKKRFYYMSYGLKKVLRNTFVR